ncbi:hypothetical protein LHGZ1_1260 [Laribacter hongkongensis]|uniref:Uncharacterized protein n=1 Tax=Laribacter hongkongensis TaxID=168471 RepID=A0A248LHX9_9NEIS|nr:hypothetical protein LHGZ1_1260 [Laribacter hongkongensis]
MDTMMEATSFLFQQPCKVTPAVSGVRLYPSSGRLGLS